MSTLWVGREKPTVETAISRGVKQCKREFSHLTLTSPRTPVNLQSHFLVSGALTGTAVPERKKENGLV